MNHSETAFRERPTDRELNPTSIQRHQGPPSRSAGLEGTEPVTTSGHYASDRKPIGEERRIAKVLVATDFSPSSAKAVEHASALANQCNAELIILHVIDVNAQAGPGHSGVAAELMKSLWEKGFAKMGQTAWSMCGRVDAQTAILEGLPWEEIVLKSREADLLVLGKTRTKASDNIFSQHTVERVIENSACPVLVVHEQD